MRIANDPSKAVESNWSSLCGATLPSTQPRHRPANGGGGSAKLLYRVTDRGLRAALFYNHAYDRVVSPGFADFDAAITSAPTELRLAMAHVAQAWPRYSEPLISQPA